MKTISLTKEYRALVDDADFEGLSVHRWFAMEVRIKGKFYGTYAARKVDRKTVLMHRVIMGAEKGRAVDHINGDTLNNTRSNLRTCSHSENMANRKQTTAKSGLKGVSLHRRTQRWIAKISKDRKRYYLGTFATAEEASAARDKAAIELHGQFAALNADLSKNLARPRGTETQPRKAPSKQHTCAAAKLESQHG